MVSRYKELLLKIARKITREELEEMKFLSDEFLPDIKPESVLVREIFMFFRGLENAKLLGENNLDWLEYLLGTVKRTDLVFMLNDFHPANDEAGKGTNLPPSNGQILTESETNDVDQSPLQAGEGKLKFLSNVGINFFVISAPDFEPFFVFVFASWVHHGEVTNGVRFL